MADLDYARYDHVRPIRWTGDALELLDQRKLPFATEYLCCRSSEDVAAAIRDLAVRGAPAIGIAAAWGVVLAARGIEATQAADAARALEPALHHLNAARPTAVNLAWSLARMRGALARAGDDWREALEREAAAIETEDLAANRRMGALGAGLIAPGSGVLTHCNTGSLATVAWGTALGIVRELHARGVLELVHVDETRPLLQGSRLTAWELRADGIAHVVQADSAAPGAILRGLVDVVVIGADRIAANGDTANKVGSVGLALACADAGVPFVVAAPWSTVDLAVPDGSGIVIEERAAEEVLAWGGVPTAPDGSRAFNPAFDVTPARLVDAVATERGVVEPKVHPDMRATAG